MSVSRDALNAYRQASTDASAVYADPHTLIAMLLDGLDDRIAIAKGALSRNDYAAKGHCIKQCVDIITYLQSCLDNERGGDIAENLDQLYSFMLQQLLRASADKSLDTLDKVAFVLAKIKTAWVAISPVQQGNAL